MTFDPPDGPLAELTTTRVGGGRSARLIALVVAGALVGVVGVAVLNQPQHPAPAAAVVPTSSAAPTVDRRPAVTPDPATAVFQVVPEGALPIYDGYGVELVVAGKRYPGQLFGAATDHLSTAFSVPASLEGSQATLALAKVSSSYSHDIVEPIGDWQVPLAHLAMITLQSTLLDTQVKGQPLRLDAPSLVQDGYEIVVRASATTDAAHLLAIEVVAHPAARTQLEGNDGIFGWAVVAQLGSYRVPRDPGSYNRCRWDVGPLAARPQQGTDESNCLR